MNQNPFPSFGYPYPFYPSPMMFVPPFPVFAPAQMMPAAPLVGSVRADQYAAFTGMSPEAALDLQKAYLRNQKQQLVQLREYVAEYARSIDEALANIDKEISQAEQAEPG